MKFIPLLFCAARQAWYDTVDRTYFWVFFDLCVLYQDVCLQCCPFHHYKPFYGNWVGYTFFIVHF